MIRFVYIGDQITEGNHDFAFFDTVHDEFMSMQGETVWGSVDEFKNYNDKMIPKEKLERCMNLIPDWYKEGKHRLWMINAGLPRSTE
jgi:hypothetical protein